MAKNNLRLYETYDRKLTKKLEDKLANSSIESSFTDNAISILNKRYFKKDENGVTQEDIYGLFQRVAANISYPDFHYSGGNEEKTAETAEIFYKMMMNKEFIPNSPTLMNAGRAMQQLSACFVLPIDDNMEGILGGNYNTGMIHKSGGGTGFSFSKIRRKNDFVSTTYGKSSGPVSFIQMFDATTHSVNQGGFRRGANMGMMRSDHPDILEFIHAKENEKETKFGNFNFSVAITDEFMNALKVGGNYVLKNPRKGEHYDLTIEDLKKEEKSVKQGLITKYERVLILEGDDVLYQNPVKRDIRDRILKVERKKVGKVDSKGRITLDAKLVFDEIAKLAWKNGEPGIAFMDEINRYNPTPAIGEIEATNPCGEQPLLPYEACNLGSINLGLMVKDGEIDYSRLEYVVKNSAHFLDNVVDMSNFTMSPRKEVIRESTEILQNILKENGIEINYQNLEERVKNELKGPIEKMVRGNRKIGLGVMGFTDMICELGIPYNSEKAIETAENVMKFIQEKGIEKTQELAEQRGAFPNFDKSIYGGGKPRRNATVTTIAPTGTISIIAGASSGVEPLFDLYYTHKDADRQIREFKDKNLVRALEKEGIDPKKVFAEISQGKSLQELDFVPKNIRDILVTSGDVAVDYHVKMQAAFQKYTDNAVSKTINLPNSATVEDVKRAYLLSYELGCKGITVYRTGSREEEVLTKKESKLEKKVGYIQPKKRPAELEGKTIKKKTGCGNIFVTRNYTERKDGTKDLFEIFAQIGKGGGCAASQNEGIGRLSSYLLRLDADPKTVASQLIGIRCHKSSGFGLNAVYSCADAIGKAIAEFYGQEVKEEIGDSQDFENLLETKNQKEIKNNPVNDDPSISGGACPQCGSPMEVKNGCIGGVCSDQECGFSECG